MECKVGKDMRLGRRSDCGSAGCVAGWIGDRVEVLRKSLDEGCAAEGIGSWVVPTKGFVDSG